MSETPTIPLAYRLLFTWIEPLFATGGALLALTDPGMLVRESLPGVPYARPMAPLFTQMAGSWLMLAFHDVFTLRRRGDAATTLAVWRGVLAAALVSDVFYTAGLAQAAGPAVFCDPRRWDASLGFTIVTTVGPLLGKVAFLLGAGLPRDRQTRAGPEDGARKRQ
ncbi:hypothetical protein GGR56DRAFT_358644 [Xylariaceae sp. FL0804]|nr:hypothetical protein GGR56DRAFT_358644 [Xylariaceae sp. FL0804]